MYPICEGRPVDRVKGVSDGWGPEKNPTIMYNEEGNL